MQNVVALRGDPPKGESEFRPVAGAALCQRTGDADPRRIPRIWHRRGRLSRDTSGSPQRRSRLGESQTQSRRRGGHRHYPVVLRQCRFPSLSRPLQQTRHPRADHPRGVAGDQPRQIRRITGMCGARLPTEFVSQLEARDADPEGQFEVGVDFAIAQVQAPLDAGVPGIHFYVLNKSPATCRVLAPLRAVPERIRCPVRYRAPEILLCRPISATLVAHRRARLDRRTWRPLIPRRRTPAPVAPNRPIHTMAIRALRGTLIVPFALRQSNVPVQPPTTAGSPRGVRSSPKNTIANRGV